MANSKNPEGQANGAGKNFLFQVFSTVFKNPLFILLTFILTLGLLGIYYFFFLKTTTFSVFFASNSALYNWLSIILTILISISFGIAISFLIWQWKSQKELNPAHYGNSFIASFLGALSIGCPVCGTFLMNFLGIAGGLALFPFQGLEIKVLSLFLLSFSIFYSAKSISRRNCLLPEELKKESQYIIKKEIIKILIPTIVGFSVLFLVAYSPEIARKFDFGFSFQESFQSTVSSPQTISESSLEILKKINPAEGYTINATYSNIGPKLLQVGAIDFEKMKSLYQKAGQPLSDEQIKILTQGSDEKIKITPENSYFLLNFLWATGLANKNPILDEGPMMKYGKDQIGNFASTGGWTLGTKKATELYSKFEIVKLTPEQQKILEEFAYNSYRPCCSNPTGFPDCNHGMAALALGEIMASQGTSLNEIFEAFKYVNAFWFPQTYFDIARYFQAKEGEDWSQVDGRIVAGKDYSTPQGWQKVRQWLVTNNLLEEPPSGGGSCGV